MRIAGAAGKTPRRKTIVATNQRVAACEVEFGQAPSKQPSVRRVATSVLDSRVERIGGSPGCVTYRGKVPQKRTLLIAKAPQKAKLLLRKAPCVVFY